MTARASTANARRVRGLLLAALLCASQAAAWAHEALVSHVICLEHGEATHASAAPRGDVPAASTPFAQLDGGPSARPGHDHCDSGVLLRRRDAVLAAAPSTGQLASPPRSTPALPGVRASIPGRALYLLAPKTSPPSANV